MVLRVKVTYTGFKDMQNDVKQKSSVKLWM